MYRRIFINFKQNLTTINKIFHSGNTQRDTTSKNLTQENLHYEPITKRQKTSESKSLLIVQKPNLQYTREIDLRTMAMEKAAKTMGKSLNLAQKSSQLSWLMMQIKEII